MGALIIILRLWLYAGVGNYEFLEDGMKGLHCSIFESKRHGNCSNSGVSSRCKSVTLCPDPAAFTDYGIPKQFEADEDSPAVVLRTICIGEREHVFAVPVGVTGSMFGGSFIYCSDSRFPMEYPIPLHDRVEEGRGYGD